MTFNRALSPALLFGFVLTSMTFTSCRREANIIYAPAACFTADRMEIPAGESVTFENCSVADDAHIYIVAAGDVHTGIVFQFDEANTYTEVFEHKGVYTATVRATNSQPGSPIAEFERVIVVTD